MCGAPMLSNKTLQTISLLLSDEIRGGILVVIVCQDLPKNKIEEI